MARHGPAIALRCTEIVETRALMSPSSTQGAVAARPATTARPSAARGNEKMPIYSLLM